MESKKQGALCCYVESRKIKKELKMLSEKKGGKLFRRPIKCKYNTIS